MPKPYSGTFSSTNHQFITDHFNKFALKYYDQRVRLSCSSGTAGALSKGPLLRNAFRQMLFMGREIAARSSFLLRPVHTEAAFKTHLRGQEYLAKVEIMRRRESMRIHSNGKPQRRTFALVEPREKGLPMAVEIDAPLQPFLIVKSPIKKCFGQQCVLANLSPETRPKSKRGKNTLKIACNQPLGTRKSYQITLP